MIYDVWILIPSVEFDRWCFYVQNSIYGVLMFKDARPGRLCLNIKMVLKDMEFGIWIWYSDVVDGCGIQCMVFGR